MWRIQPAWRKPLRCFGIAPEALLTAFVALAALISSVPRAASAEPAPLTWGADATSGAPYVFDNPANPALVIGFETDIIEAVARRLHRPSRFVQNRWDNLIPGLERGLYDVAIDGIEITPEHQAVVDFSIPYYTTFEQLVVRKETPGVTTLDDLAGLKVGTLKATLAQRILDKAGTMKVFTYDEQLNVYADLQNGRLDAVLLDAPIALYYATPYPDLRFVGDPIALIRYGIAVPKGRTDLLSQINAALADIRESGELRWILERWKLWNPLMAAELNDSRPSHAQPTEFNAFMAATALKLGWRAVLERYLGFLPLIGRGALITLGLSILSMALAIALGLLLALARGYTPRPFSSLAAGYIEVMRGTPLLIQILFVYYGLPNIGLKLDPFVAGVLALAFNYAAYEAENYRAGLQAVPRGQMEAAIALNLTRVQSLRYVIVPQAIRIVLPTMTNDFISLLKDSSLVSVITMVELTQTYLQLSTTYYDYFGTGLMVAAVYLVMGLPFVRLARWTEERFKVDMHPGGARRRGAVPFLRKGITP